MSEIDILLGKSIRAQRHRAGLSREALARKLCVSAHTIAAIEDGQRRANAPQLFEIADVLDVKIAGLFNWPEETAATPKQPSPAPPFEGEARAVAGHYDALSMPHRKAVFAFLLALSRE
ncbi:MAG: helix-turn-helix transcriptional regulator [Rhodobacteraceae bacterium]|nr:helix-turn-helix transcriptional regulator [Paracoccaceae bacterium]MCW9042690.1 helix-turn-helix transcriptional regulator [Pseudopelagicola sp.]